MIYRFITADGIDGYADVARSLDKHAPFIVRLCQANRSVFTGVPTPFKETIRKYELRKRRNQYDAVVEYYYHEVLE